MYFKLSADQMFKGIYNGRQCHVADIPAVLARAWTAGIDRIIVSIYWLFLYIIPCQILFYAHVSWKILLKGHRGIARRIEGGPSHCRNRWSVPKVSWNCVLLGCIPAVWWIVSVKMHIGLYFSLMRSTVWWNAPVIYISILFCSCRAAILYCWGASNKMQGVDSRALWLALVFEFCRKFVFFISGVLVYCWFLLVV